MLVTDRAGQPIEHIGIGAFVSPQWLAAEGDGVVLDLAAREMHTAPWDEATRSLDERGGLEIAPTGARLCRDESSAIRGLAFVLPGSVDGHAVQLLLDTGAPRTDLLTSSHPAKLLQGRAKPSREQMYAASGLVRTSLVRAAEVKIGQWSLTTDVDLVPGVADAADLSARRRRLDGCARNVHVVARAQLCSRPLRTLVTSPDRAVAGGLALAVRCARRTRRSMASRERPDAVEPRGR